jgi:RAT1-interacting protein
VGFRTPKGRVTTTQSFKTLEIPRLVRGKEKAWDPLLCLAWADQFLAFLMNAVSGPDHGASCVWRVKFIPREGVRVRVLSENEVKEVEGGEERIGFLPRWYWDELERSSGSPNGEG